MHQNLNCIFTKKRVSSKMKCLQCCVLTYLSTCFMGIKLGRKMGLRGGGGNVRLRKCRQNCPLCFSWDSPLHNKKSLFSQFVKNCSKTKKNVKIIFVKSLRGQYDSQLIFFESSKNKASNVFISSWLFLQLLLLELFQCYYRIY